MYIVHQLINKRKKLNIPQHELASRLEVTQSLLSRWERGESYPRIPEVEKWAEIVGMRLVLVEDESK